MASYTISPIWGAGAQLFDNSGNVLTGGKVYTYLAGTTTLATTYTTPIGSTANSNPIVANAAGRLTNEIWFPVSGAYKFVLKDANDVLLATYDNIPTIPQPPVVNDASSVAYEPGYEVTAGNFTVGATYLITSVGTTDFVAIGAAANITGIHFTATGVGSGTGTAEYSRTVQSKLRETVSVKDFGAVGDGVTDDTAAIQNAFNHSSAIGVTLTAEGSDTYLVRSLTAPSNLTFDMQGATLKLAPAQPVLSYVIRVQEVSNVKIYNGTIDGNRSNQVNPGTPEDGGFHGLGIRRATDSVFQDLTLQNCATDGIFIAGISPTTWSERLSIVRCVSNGNARQGMSLISVISSTFEDCTFSNTSGRAPQSGVDVEPDHATQEIDVYFKGITRCFGNAGRGFVSDIMHSTTNTRTIQIDTLISESNAGEELALVRNGSISFFAERLLCAGGLIYLESIGLLDFNVNEIKCRTFQTNGATGQINLNIQQLLMKGGSSTSTVSPPLNLSNAGNKRIIIGFADVENLGGNLNSYSGWIEATDVQIGQYISRSARGLRITGTATGANQIYVVVPQAMLAEAVRLQGTGWNIQAAKTVADGQPIIQLEGDNNVITTMWNSGDQVSVTGLTGATRNKITVNSIDSTAAAVNFNSGANYNYVDANNYTRSTAGVSFTDAGTGNVIELPLLTGAVAYNPPSLNDGDGTTTTVTVTGASLGDIVAASFSNGLQGIIVTAWVSAADTVSVRFQNETGGTIDLANGTLRVSVRKTS